MFLRGRRKPENKRQNYRTGDPEALTRLPSVERIFRFILPAVFIPEQQAHVVDDGWLAQADLDPCAASIVLYRVSGEAVVQVVVLSVSVQQSRLQLALHYHGSVLHSGYVLFWDYMHTRNNQLTNTTVKASKFYNI